MTNRIIFLDIDGPLLPGRMWYHPENAALRKEYGASWWHKFNENPEFAERITFDPVAVAWYNIWTKFSGTKVVVASNWRRWLDRDVLEKIFHHNGLDFELHDDWQTMAKMTSNRVHEIGMWMDDHKEYEALIIDDDKDLAESADWFKGGEIKNTDWMNRAMLISPDYTDGLTTKHFQDGLTFLGISTEIIGEEIFGMIPLTEEEKIQRQKDLDLLLSCIC